MTSDSVQLTNMGLAQARPKSLTEPPRLKQSKVDSLLDYQDSSESSGSSPAHPVFEVSYPGYVVYIIYSGGID